jgi:choline-glycine betaine transporter
MALVAQYQVVVVLEVQVEQLVQLALEILPLKAVLVALMVVVVALLTLEALDSVVMVAVVLSELFGLVMSEHSRQQELMIFKEQLCPHLI